jgi:hypothetical protein
VEKLTPVTFGRLRFRATSGASTVARNRKRRCTPRSFLIVHSSFFIHPRVFRMKNEE